MLMYLSVLALALLIAVPACYSSMTRGYADRIRNLESRLSMLRVEQEDKEAEVVRLAAEEDDLRRRRVALLEGDGALPSLGTDKAPAAYAAPEDYLVDVGLLSAKDLEKARAYKSGSRSEYGLGEVLVMMKVIDSTDWEFAKSKVKSS